MEKGIKPWLNSLAELGQGGYATRFTWGNILLLLIGIDLKYENLYLTPVLRHPYNYMFIAHHFFLQILSFKEPPVFYTITSN